MTGREKRNRGPTAKHEPSRSVDAAPARSSKQHRSHSAPADPARLAAFRTLRAVSADNAYANLALAEHAAGLSARDAAFATELVAGTCRAQGLYDAIIASASARELRTLQPAVVLSLIHI